MREIKKVTFGKLIEEFDPNEQSLEIWIIVIFDSKKCTTCLLRDR